LAGTVVVGVERDVGGGDFDDADDGGVAIVAGTVV